MRLIDVDALIDKIHDKGEYRKDNCEIINLIEIAPVVDSRTAHWVKKYDVSELSRYATEYTPKWYCSWCGQSYDPHMADDINYCCICGAKMLREDGE